MGSKAISLLVCGACFAAPTVTPVHAATLRQEVRTCVIDCDLDDGPMGVQSNTNPFASDGQFNPETESIFSEPRTGSGVAADPLVDFPGALGQNPASPAIPGGETDSDGLFSDKPYLLIPSFGE